MKGWGRGIFWPGSVTRAAWPGAGLLGRRGAGRAFRAARGEGRWRGLTARGVPRGTCRRPKAARGGDGGGRPCRRRARRRGGGARGGARGRGRARGASALLRGGAGGRHRVAVDAVQANAAVAQPLGQHGAQLEGGAQLHLHLAAQVLLGQQRQRGPVYPLVAERLSTQQERVTTQHKTHRHGVAGSRCVGQTDIRWSAQRNGPFLNRTKYSAVNTFSAWSQLPYFPAA